jgi:peroxin-7
LIYVYCILQVECSPFDAKRFACAASQHFGIVGNGRQYVLELNPAGQFVPVAQFDTRDGLYDCSWSESNEAHLIAGSGDGSIKMFDIYRPGRPIREWREHQREVYGVDWNLVTKNSFLSASWDDTIKLWVPERVSLDSKLHSLQTCK